MLCHLTTAVFPAIFKKAPFYGDFFLNATPLFIVSKYNMENIVNVNFLFVSLFIFVCFLRSTTLAIRHPLWELLLNY